MNHLPIDARCVTTEFFNSRGDKFNVSDKKLVVLSNI